MPYVKEQGSTRKQRKGQKAQRVGANRGREGIETQRMGAGRKRVGIETQDDVRLGVATPDLGERSPILGLVYLKIGLQDPGSGVALAQDGAADPALADAVLLDPQARKEADVALRLRGAPVRLRGASALREGGR